MSKDPVVIGELLSASKDLYPNHAPAELQSDIGFLADLGLTLPDTVYEENDPRVAREAMLAEMDLTSPPDDGVVEIEPVEKDAEKDSDEPMVRFVTALRHLEILGQVLKNFPGSLEGGVKLEIARECYDLGVRSLSVVFDMIRSEQTEILKQFSEMIRERHPELTTLEVDNRAKETLVGLAHVLSYGMIQRVAQSVGSRELSNTFERLLEGSRTPAFRLINSALELDNKAEFPDRSIQLAADEFEKAPLPLSVLRHLVITHFYLFPVDFRTKQRICANLGIT